MKAFASAVSYLLHPWLMPLYSLFFLFNSGSLFACIPRPVKWYCYGVTVLTLWIVPVLSLPLFKRLHWIKDYGLEDKQERVCPILAAVVSAFVGFWLLGRVAYTQIVQQLYLALIILLSVFSVITLRWKMSMHMTAVGGVCGFLLLLGVRYAGEVRFFLMGMLLGAGMLASCRLYLKKHTPFQIYAGFLFGLAFVAGILF